MSTFEASTAYVEQLSRIFRAVGSVASEGALVLDESGIKVQITDPSHAFAAFIFMPPEMFAFYSCPEHFRLKLNLVALALCLKMYVDWSPLNRQRRGDSGRSRAKRPSDAQCVLQYSNFGDFELRFSHDSMTSVCLFSVFADPDSDAEIEIDVENIVLQTIMLGETFESILKEFIALEAEHLTIGTSQAPDRLHFSVLSELANTQMTFLEDPKTIHTLNIEDSAAFRYSFKALCKVREAAKLASQVSVRFDYRGVLSIQLIYEFDEQKAFVEFRFLPLVD